MTSKSDNSLNDRVTKLEVQVKAIQKDLEDIENIKETSIKQSTQYEYIITSLDEIKQQVKEISTKPNKYWDNIITAIVTAIGTGIVLHLFKF